MKSIFKFLSGLLIPSLLVLPAAADAHWSGGGALIGFGTGLLTGYLLAPRPVAAAAPPVYTAPNTPPPPDAYPPPPAPPAAPGDALNAPPTLPPGSEATCREWRAIERRTESRWDSYNNKWQQVPVEKWGWVDVPCNTPGAAPAPPLEANIQPPPPAYEFSSPPAVAVIPGTYVYVVPNIGVDILFYHGYWYRPYAGRWYWAVSFNGPWVFLPPARVPRPLLALPPGYHRIPPGYRLIPYAHLHENWGRWERERYWNRDREWREGWHDHRR